MVHRPAGDAADRERERLAHRAHDEAVPVLPPEGARQGQPWMSRWVLFVSLPLAAAALLGLFLWFAV